MRRRKMTKRAAVLVLAAALAAGSTIPLMAENRNGMTGDIEYATPANARKATAADASKKEFALEDMPEIGSNAFTTWFFDNTDQQELWEYIFALMEEETEESEAFLAWMLEHEERFQAAYEKFSGNGIMLLNSATGNLWDEWTGAKMNWDGTGTRNNPYKITGISELMGLSEAVAQGESFKGKYFELQSDIDLGNLNLNNGCWNPIGWYKNVSDLSGVPATAFEGTFDGAGNTVSGLKFTKIDHDYSYLGLFGFIKGAVIKNLTVEAEEVSGQDNIAILAGCIEGKSTIYNVSVNGAVYAEGDAGGIAGEITGGTENAVVENCSAEVMINSEGVRSFTGGIAGNVQKADIVDVSVLTQDGDSDRIRGKGYVGGIVGRQNSTNIYNAYVTGTIGGNLAAAAGGITGLYESGNIIVAQMDGEIGRTNNGTASHEGAIIGTRESRNSFRYGTGKNDNLSYLFVNEHNKSMTKSIVGAGFSDDNTYTYEANIGYYTDYQKKYTLVAGTNEKGSGERFFYEELEDGIKYIITQKLGKELTVDYSDGEPFRIDHWAPGNQGEPVKGYLVSIPRIDAKNANGTYDNDVAVLTAISSTNNSYYRQIDKDNPSAVAPGCTITVATAAKNKNGNRYQLVYDADAEGKAKVPTYTDEEGNRQDMTYVNGGSYTFIMPKCDTELNAEYVKVTTALTMEPEETSIAVTQTRTGDRKNPQIVTEVRNAEGTLIAKYINGAKDTSVQVQPVAIHAEHNGEGSAADRTVAWSIDDTDLLNFEDGWTGGYTTNDAKVIPNMNSDFIQNLIMKKVQEQADGGYKQAIDNTIHTDSAVVTAVTNPSTSVDNKAVSGNCKVNVTFQIIDQTTVRVEGMVLNQTNISFQVERRLTGNRKDPNEVYVVTEPISLDASLNPSQPFFKNVTWADKESGKIVSLTPTGTNQQSCVVSVVCSEDGKNNPSWIQNIINADNSKKKADNGYLKLTGNGTYTETIAATSEDQTNGIVTAECTVTINFVTNDQTVIYPEDIELSKAELEYDLSYQYEGDIDSEVRAKKGFGEQENALTAAILPNLEENEGHQPFERTVIWTSSEPDALTVKNGIITIKDNAAWIQEALKQAPYQAEKKVVITAKTKNGEKSASCEVTLKFQAYAIAADRDEETFNILLTKTGRKSNPTLTWSGADAKKLSASVYGTDSAAVKWESGDNTVLTVKEDGTVIPITTDDKGTVKAAWIGNAMKTSPYKAEKETFVTVSASDGSMTDKVPVKLTFTMTDNTYSGGSSGGSGGSSGGGSSSKGVTPSGTKVSFSSSLPAYVVSGNWVQDNVGRWLFTNTRTYKNEWAAVHNPYADASIGQPQFDWFRFDPDGYMVTGWFTDPADGNTYYLHTVSDNTLGHMYTGWQWIDDDRDGTAECYYFNPTSDGARGRLYKNTITPDGFTVNEKGQWTVSGVVQTKRAD